MGVLDRYKKQGGFKSLLSLLETCGPQKQAQFLKSIQAESPAWELALSKKILSVKRILDWGDEPLRIIIKETQDLTIAYVISGLNDEEKEKFFSACSNRGRQRFLEVLQYQTPNPAEISTAFRKFIEVVRELLASGLLNAASIDPDLIIEPDIERHLTEQKEHSFPSGRKQASSSFFNSQSRPQNQVNATSPKPPESVQRPGSLDADKIQLFIRERSQLLEENEKLRKEVTNLKATVDQIKKLLAS